MPRPDAGSGSPALRAVAERVQELHHPARTRILLELAADVEALSAELRRGGIPEEEATVRAAERVVPSEAAVDALVRLHRPLYRRLVAPLPDTALRRWERGALLAATMFILAAGVVLLGRQGLLATASPFLWAVLALAGGVVCVTLWKFFQLFVRREHRPGSLDRGLGALLGFAGAALAVAWAGGVADLWVLASTLERGVPDPVPLLTAWLFRESVLVGIGLLTAIAGGLSWFLLAQGTAAVRCGDQEVRRTLARDAGSGRAAAEPSMWREGTT